MYIPYNPAKYGIKIVMVNDVKSKYMLSGIPYLGKQGTPQPKYDPKLGHIFAKNLTQRCQFTNRNVMADNWFTSAPLIQDLLHSFEMTLTGTVRGEQAEDTWRDEGQDDTEAKFQ